MNWPPDMPSYSRVLTDYARRVFAAMQSAGRPVIASDLMRCHALFVPGTKKANRGSINKAFRGLQEHGLVTYVRDPERQGAPWVWSLVPGATLPDDAPVMRRGATSTGEWKASQERITVHSVPTELQHINASLTLAVVARATLKGKP